MFFIHISTQELLLQVVDYLFNDGWVENERCEASHEDFDAGSAVIAAKFELLLVSKHRR